MNENYIEIFIENIDELIDEINDDYDKYIKRNDLNE